MQVRATVPSEWATGVAATALIPTGSRMGIAIPERAVVRRGQLTGGRGVTPEGAQARRARLGRTVPAAKTGETDSEARVEVLSGLEAGERIVR